MRMLDSAARRLELTTDAKRREFFRYGKRRDRRCACAIYSRIRMSGNLLVVIVEVNATSLDALELQQVGFLNHVMYPVCLILFLLTYHSFV